MSGCHYARTSTSRFWTMVTIGGPFCVPRVSGDGRGTQLQARVRRQPMMITAMIDSTAVAITAIAAFEAALIGWLGWRTKRSELGVRNTELGLDRNDHLIDQMQEQLNFMVEQNKADRTMVTKLEHGQSLLRHRLLAYELGVAKLIGQLEHLDVVPVWRPPAPQTAEPPAPQD